MRQELVSEVLALPAVERRLLVEAIWDSIAAEPEAFTLTDWQKEELDLRLADLEADSDSVRHPKKFLSGFGARYEPRVRCSKAC
jgi:putative addiction module component (TIGR02574 family)